MQIRFAILLALAAPLAAQSGLTLSGAVKTALDKHPAVEATAAQSRAAATRTAQARSGWLPKVSYSESFQRSNNPVFVFGSLLTQHQFGVENFEIGRLNRPDFLNNFQSQLTVDQSVYDGGQVKHQLRLSELGRQVASEDERRARMGVVAGVIRAYYGAVLAGESLKVAAEAVRSAEADLVRAEAVRQAGMSTEADVLSIKVHAAAMREQQIRRAADLRVAQAALNESLGLGLDANQELTTPLEQLKAAAASREEYERKATGERPEARQAQLSSRLAETQVGAARTALLPQVGVRGMFEADRQRFVTRGGANWMLAATLRWNVFNGFADRARIEEASEALAGAKAVERQTGNAIRLQVRRAYEDLASAGQRISVAGTAVTMAEESLRIIKNRYDAGLATVTDLLRNETAVMEARTRHLGAIHDQRVAAAMLELAAGTLSAESEVLK